MRKSPDYVLVIVFLGCILAIGINSLIAYRLGIASRIGSCVHQPKMSSSNLCPPGIRVGFLIFRLSYLCENAHTSTGINKPQRYSTEDARR